jgi:hypothetical protein
MQDLLLLSKKATTPQHGARSSLLLMMMVQTSGPRPPGRANSRGGALGANHAVARSPSNTIDKNTQGEHKFQPADIGFPKNPIAPAPLFHRDSEKPSDPVQDEERTNVRPAIGNKREIRSPSGQMSASDKPVPTPANMLILKTHTGEEVPEQANIQSNERSHFMAPPSSSCEDVAQPPSRAHRCACRAGRAQAGGRPLRSTNQVDRSPSFLWPLWLWPRRDDLT